MAMRSDRSSTYFPAQGFSITATAAAFRVGGEISRSISRCVSSTKVAILRIFAFILSSLGFPLLSQTVFSLDLGGLEAANSRMNASAGGHYQGQHDIVAAGSIVEANLHGVEMTAHVRRVDVGNGDIEAHTWSAHLFCGSHDGFGS